MKNIKYSIFLFVCVIQNLSSVGISTEDAWVLDQYLHYVFTEESFGYVLEKVKPVSGTGYFIQDHYYPGTENHRRNTLLREGSRVWDQYFSEFDSEWTVYNAPSAFHPKLNSLSLIHRPTLERTIEENIALFKAFVGSTHTAKGLAQDLTNREIPFPKPLNNNSILIGIVLGYGANNSSLVSRSETLSGDQRTESPPLKTRMRDEIKCFPMVPNFEPKILPNYGFATVEEELEALWGRTEHSSNALVEEKPNLLFGCEKGCKETKERILLLEKAQKQIQTLLARPDFAQHVIAELTGEKVDISPQKPSHFGSLSKAIAHSIFETWEEGSDQFYRGFVQGMSDSFAERQAQTLNNRMNQYQETLVLKNALATQKESEKYLAGLDSTYKAIVPEKVFFKQRCEGHGNPYANQRYVKLYLSIMMGPHHRSIYFSDGVKEFDLQETIPGLAYALKGMKQGERREVILHPEYGYGIYTSLERGQFLTAIIEYVDAGSEEILELPTITQNKLPSAEEIAQTQFEAGYVMGYRTWNHYKKHPSVSFDELIQIVGKGPHPLDVTADEKLQLDRLNIAIYEVKIATG